MRACLGVGLTLICCEGIATAQTPAPQRRVDISLSNRIEYDSNVFRVPDEVDGLTTRSGDDFRTTPSVNLDILFPLGRQSLFLNGSIGYDFYKDNSQLNSERISLSGGADIRLFGCNTLPTADYSRRQSDFDDLFLTGRLKNVEEASSAGVRIECGDAIGLRPAVGYRHTSVTNSAALRTRDNYKSDTLDAELAYAGPTFGTLSLFGTYQDSIYPNRVSPGPPAITDGVEVYTLGVRYERRIGSRISGVISAGYTKVEPKLPGVPGFNGTSYSGDLSYRGDAIRLNLGFSRAAELSNLLDISYSITENYSLDGEYALGRSLALTFGTSYSERSFELSPLVPAPVARTGDKTYQGFVGLNYRANDRISFSLDFVQERRDSPGGLFDYKSSRAGFGVRLNI